MIPCLVNTTLPSTCNFAPENSCHDVRKSTIVMFGTAESNLLRDEKEIEHCYTICIIDVQTPNPLVDEHINIPFPNDPPCPGDDEKGRTWSVVVHTRREDVVPRSM